MARAGTRYREPTVWDGFLHYLSREGYPIPASQLTRDHTRPLEATSEVQQILLTVYRRDAKNTEICERLVDLDEGFAEWRYHHVRMVERTIGEQAGHGRVAGAAYLRDDAWGAICFRICGRSARSCRRAHA